MPNPIQYDPELTEKYAKRLSIRAIIAYIIWPLVGIFIAYVVIPQILPVNNLWVVSLIGVILGYLYGSYRAVIFRLKAQEALCLKQIEENTRK